MFRLKKVIKNIKGSEVVEKMLMVIVSVTLVAVAIGFMNKYINGAIEKQGGIINGSSGNGQIVMPNPDLNDNGNNNDIDSKILGNWKFKQNLNFDDFKDINYKFKAISFQDSKYIIENKKAQLEIEGIFFNNINEIVEIETSLYFEDNSSIYNSVLTKFNIYTINELKNYSMQIKDISTIDDKNIFLNWLNLVAIKQNIKAVKANKINNAIMQLGTLADLDKIVSLNDEIFVIENSSLVKYNENLTTKTVLCNANHNNISVVGNRLFGIYHQQDLNYITIEEFDFETNNFVAFANFEIGYNNTYSIGSSENKIYFFDCNGAGMIIFDIVSKSEVRTFSEGEKMTPFQPCEPYYCDGFFYFQEDFGGLFPRYNINKNTFDQRLNETSVFLKICGVVHFFNVNDTVYCFRNDGILKAYDINTDQYKGTIEISNYDHYINLDRGNSHLNYFSILKLKSKLLIETMDTNMNPVYYEIPLSEFVA